MSGSLPTPAPPSGSRLPPPCSDASPFYNAYTAELVQARHRARVLMHKFNHSLPIDPVTEVEGGERRKYLGELLGLDLMGKRGREIEIEPPLYVDYGTNIELQGAFYANYGACILDVAQVRIGPGVLFGPNVQLYGATHGISVKERQEGIERGGEINIGAHTWVGGGAIINAGVTLGKGCTVGGGSVVTKSFPDWSVVVGSPARLIKVVPEHERGSDWDPAAAAAAATEARPDENKETEMPAGEA